MKHGYEPGGLLGREDVGRQLLDPLLVEVDAVLHLLAGLLRLVGPGRKILFFAKKLCLSWQGNSHSNSLPRVVFEKKDKKISSLGFPGKKNMIFLIKEFKRNLAMPRLIQQNSVLGKKRRGLVLIKLVPPQAAQLMILFCNRKSVVLHLLKGPD